jgi:alanine-synthesizing transaminase
VFSARTRWDRTVNRLARAVEARKANGRRVIDLTESNPTRPAIPYPADLLAGLADLRGRRYDPIPAGWRGAREAVAGEYTRHGVPVAPEHIVLTASSSEAYSFVFKLLCDPGDEVLVPAPSYPLFDFLAGLENVVVRPYPLLLAGGEWHVDVAAPSAAVGPRARAIVVVNPNNPTGSFVKNDEAAALAELAARHDLALVSDEVFLDYAGHADSRRAGTLAAPGAALTFVFGGLSKSCGLPQLKLGWIVTAGPEDLRREALERLEIIADTYLSVGTPVQLAAPSLLARGGEIREAIQSRVASNRTALEWLCRNSPVSVLPAEGGWYAVLRVPATRSEEALVTELVEAHGVLVHPGFFFGFPHEAYVVLSLLPEPDVLAEGVEALLENV